MHEEENKEDIKEDFCGACAVIPLALVGVTGAGIGTKQYGTTKKVMLWGGIALTIISIIIVIIYLKRCKNCK